MDWHRYTNKIYSNIKFLQFVNIWFFLENFQNMPDILYIYRIDAWFLSNFLNYYGTFNNYIYIYLLILIGLSYIFWQLYILFDLDIIKIKILSKITQPYIVKNIQLWTQNQTRIILYWLIQLSVFGAIIYTALLTYRLIIILIFSDIILLHISFSSLIIKLIISIFILFWWIMVLWAYRHKPIQLFKPIFNKEIVILYLLVIFLLYKLIDCIDLLEFILLFETSSLVFCILGAFSTNITASVTGNMKHIEAALKLYLNSSVSSGFLLLGLGLIYGASGCHILSDITQLHTVTFEIHTLTLYNADIRLPDLYDNSLLQKSISYNQLESAVFTELSNSNTLISPDLFVVGCLCFFIALGLKLTIVPMHLWIFDIYEGSNLLFISFIGIVPKIVFWFLFAKIYLLYFHINWILAYLFFFLGFITSLYAAICGYIVIKLKEFLVLSTLLTSGYVLMIISYGGSLNFICIFLSILYLVTYSIGMSSILIFLIAHPTILDLELKQVPKYLLFAFLQVDNNILSTWSGFSKIEQIYVYILIFAIFTCLGIPPFSGFISKLFIFKITSGSFIGATTFWHIEENYLDFFWDMLNISGVDLKLKLYLFDDIGQIILILIFLLISLLSIILYFRIIKVILFNNITHQAIFTIKNILLFWVQGLHGAFMLFLFIGITIFSIFLHAILF